MQYEREMIEVPPSDHASFPTNEFQCQPPSRDLAKSIAEHGIIEPVVICEWNGGWYVMGGQRRILVGIALGIDIPVALYHGIDPEDTLAWIPILNDTGQENPIHTLYAIKKMIARGDSFEEIRTQMFMTKQKLEKIMRLDILPPVILGAVQDGKVAITTAEALASKGKEYFDDAVVLYHQNKDKLTASDVRGLSTLHRQNTLADMFMNGTPDAHSGEENLKRYAVFEGSKFITFAKDRDDARGAAMMTGDDAEVYQLIRVYEKE